MYAYIHNKVQRRWLSFGVWRVTDLLGKRSSREKKREKKKRKCPKLGSWSSLQPGLTIYGTLPRAFGWYRPHYEIWEPVGERVNVSIRWCLIFRWGVCIMQLWQAANTTLLHNVGHNKKRQHEVHTYSRNMAVRMRMYSERRNYRACLGVTPPQLPETALQILCNATYEVVYMLNENCSNLFSA
jgi:hypothetical protein